MSWIMRTLIVLIIFIMFLGYSFSELSKFNSELLKFNEQNTIHNVNGQENNFLNQKNNSTINFDRIIAAGSIHDFSAVVNKSDGLVTAYDYKGSIIAEGRDGIEDSAVIQAAIDRFIGGGEIFIKKNDYFIGSTIILNSHIKLELEAGTTLIPTKNIDLIRVKPGSELSGGIFDVSNVEFTRSVILIDGSDEFGITNHALIEGATINNYQNDSQKPRGNAIWFRLTNATSGHISGVHVSNIVISGAFKYGILMSNPTESPDSWINGNLFDSIIGEGAEYFIYIDNTYGTKTDGNNFYGIQYQTTNNSKCVITIGGKYNSFNCLIWDWQLASGDYAINFLENSTENYLQKYTNVKINDNGHNNTILPNPLV